MSLFLKSDANVSNPVASMPYLEKDYAIIRGVTRAMFDFSNPECHTGAGELIGGSTTFKDLTINNGEAKAQANSTHIFAPVENGMVKVLGGSRTGRFISLGSQFKFPSTTRKALIVLHAKIPKSGWYVSSMVSLIGAGVSAGVQYLLYAASDENGALKSLTFRIKGSSGNIDAILQGSSLNKISGTLVQQLGLSISISNSVATLNFLIDGEIVSTGSGSATQLEQYDSSGGSATLQALFLGPSTGFSSNQTIDLRLGRVSCHDLTNRSDITVESILLKDRTSASGYVY